jgi:hypothetical protein
VSASTVKHFGPKRAVEPAKIVPFSVGFVRDGVEEPHEFAARLRVSYADTVGLVKNQDGAGALPFLDRLIRRSLVDDDGTPTKWQPEVNDGKVVAPDGTEVDIADAQKYTAFEAGSSRRRWAHLMDSDEDVEVELEQIMEVFEHLTSEAANGRPTSRSSRSSR